MPKACGTTWVCGGQTWQADKSARVLTDAF
eukprot:SAG31_NODE_13469_length_867_cov_0.890625_2_plen_29_part_01